MPVGSVPTSCALRAASPGPTIQRATTDSGPQCSRVHTACPSATALPAWRYGPTHHLLLRATQIGRRPDSNRRLVRKALTTNMETDIGGRSLHRHGSFNNATSFTKWCSPAANFRRSSHRLAALSLLKSTGGPSEQLLAGSPPSCQHHGNGRVRDLVTSVELAVATFFRQLPVPSRVAQYGWQHTTRVCHPANPGGCHQFKMLKHRAGRFERALLGAPVPAG